MMMSDTPSDEDLLDEDDDISLDDLDDDGEDWDTFNEDDDLLDEGVNLTDAQEGGPQKKTFLQKYFYVVVGVIVAAAAGLFVLAQGGGGHDTSAPAPADMVAQDTAPDAQPVAGNVEESIELPEDTATVSEALEADDSVLTPMPSLSDGKAVPEALPSLDLALDGTQSNDEPLEDMETLSELDLIDEAFEAPAETVDDALNADAGPDTNPDIEAVEEAAALPLEELQDDEGLQALQETAATPDPSPDMPALEDTPADMQAITQDAQADEDIQPIENTQLQEAQAQAMAEKDVEIAALQAELLEQADMAENEIADLRETITALNAEIAALKTKASEAAVSKAPQAKEAATATVQTKPVTDKTSKPVSKVVTPKPAPKKTAPKVQWRLKSAQNGQAVIANISGDLKAIEVGNTVRGLGRIQSISVENGKWVVRGTQGRLSQ